MPARCPACGQPIPEPAQRIDQIQAEVASYYLIPYTALVGPDKQRKYARPRQVSYWLANQLTPYSIAKIARSVHRDHTTVSYGIVRIERLANYDQTLSDDLEELQVRLTNSHA